MIVWFLEISKNTFQKTWRAALTVACNQPSLTDIQQPEITSGGGTRIFPNIHEHKQPSLRASRWHTWLADEGPEASGTVTVVALGNFRSTGTNVKVNGTPSSTWQKEQRTIRHRRAHNYPHRCKHTGHGLKSWFPSRASVFFPKKFKETQREANGPTSHRL